MGRVGCVQLFKILVLLSSGRVEQNLPPHVDVGEPWVVEDQERGSMDFVVVPIHKVHRKACSAFTSTIS
jgi:hypothetical protein